MSIPAESLASRTLDPADEMAARLRAQYAERITGELVIPAKLGQYRPFPSGLDARLAKALQKRGMTQLYTHQATAWESV